MKAQVNLLDEIIVDNFAGGGGASTGMELASGRPVTIAINHSPDAILLHKTNHPYTEHLQASVWDVDPVEVCKGRPVGLAWFSPDCKHFSKAKGAALVDRNIRGLAWIVLRWAAMVKPRVIMLENVEEFQSWGPVRKGKPVKKLAGQTFQRWKEQLHSLGYEIDHRELVAADYGAPTTRKRFCLVARRDGQPIVWPEPTHGPRDSEAVKSGKLLPWRSAAEVIDWSLPGYSIFDTRAEIKAKYGVNAVRPLADNTLRRVIRGVDKFTIRSGTPFLVECNHGGGSHRRPVAEPVNTLTRKYTGGICSPLMAPVTFSNTCNSIGGPASDPVHTITSAGNQILASANLMGIGQTGGGDRVRDMRDPTHTTVSKAEDCCVAASLIQYHTEQTESARVSGLTAPINTVDASNRYGLAAASLVEYYGNGTPLDIEAPMHTATSHDREGLVAAHIEKYFDGGYKGCGNEAGEPLTTVTSLPRHSLCSAHIVKYYTGVTGSGADAPLPTVTAVDHNGLCAAHVVKYKGQELGQQPDKPLPTVTAQGQEYADCRVHLGQNLGHWPEIRDLLNRFCGYELGEDDVILLTINGASYFIADITLRMLTPRELYNAMGFPPDYIIDHDYTGKPYPKTAQVARCGNAVCPPMAAALVRANLPEWCASDIKTMTQLDELIAM